MSTSPIEWTEVTWNPTSGCDRISPGCDHCYALTLAKRLKAMGQPKYQTGGDPRTSGPGFGVALHPNALLEPLGWRKPRKVFVDSMADLSVGVPGPVAHRVGSLAQAKTNIRGSRCARQVSLTARQCALGVADAVKGIRSAGLPASTGGLAAPAGPGV
jgi:hypothetical protein